MILNGREMLIKIIISLFKAFTLLSSVPPALPAPPPPQENLLVLGWGQGMNSRWLFLLGEVKCPDFRIPASSSELVARCQVRLAHSCRLQLSARGGCPCQRPEREAEIAYPHPHPQRSSHSPGSAKENASCLPSIQTHLCIRKRKSCFFCLF